MINLAGPNIANLRSLRLKITNITEDGSKRCFFISQYWNAKSALSAISFNNYKTSMRKFKCSRPIILVNSGTTTRVMQN